MTRKLIIIMANSDPRNGEELGAPIFQASVAAALEYDVEVVCTATAGKLMKKGVAESLVIKPGSPRTVYDFIKDACQAGVKFYCCSPNSACSKCRREREIAEDCRMHLFCDASTSKLSVDASMQ
jgi:predicted peroxiredoxin